MRFERPETRLRNRRLLRDGAAESSVRPLAAPTETATVLFSLVGWAYIHLRSGHRWEPDRAREATLDPTLNGVGGGVRLGRHVLQSIGVPGLAFVALKQRVDPRPRETSMKTWHLLICAVFIGAGALLIAAGADGLAFVPAVGCAVIMGAMVWMMARGAGGSERQ